MRLSWYANTGVAVFSIWQGNTCTGTFRLPIADLPRMIDTLRRGPHGDAGDPAAAHHPGDYEDEPTGVYRGDLLSDDYPDDPGPRHRRPDSALSSGYREDPSGRDRDDPLHSGHRDGRHASGYPVEPPAGYRDSPLGGGYQDDRLGGGNRRGGDRRGGDHPDGPLAGGYPAEQVTARYAEDPLGGDYPTGPSGPYYPDAIDSRDYPGPSGNAGYSPARPYVAPGTGEGHRHRRAVGREESDASPDSFRYGQPPAGREARGRGR